MRRKWPWFEFRYVFVWWPVCWQGWALILVLWGLIGSALLLRAYIPNGYPFGFAEAAVFLAYAAFAFSKTDFGRWCYP